MHSIRDRAIQSARLLVGTPYRRFGRTPGQGLDCVGLVIAIGASLNIVLHSPDFYRIATSADQLIAWTRGSGLVQIEEVWSPGTVVVVQKSRVSHFVIAMPDNSIVEARNDVGVCRVVYTARPETHVAVGAFAFPEEERS